MSKYYIDIDLIKKAKDTYHDAVIAIESDITALNTAVEKLDSTSYAGSDADRLREAIRGYNAQEMAETKAELNKMAYKLQLAQSQSQMCKKKCHDFVFGLGGESSIRTYESFEGGLLCDEEQICGLIYTANEARKEADRINYTGEMVINALNNLKVLKTDYSSYAGALKKECDNIENALFTHIQDLTAYATNVENMDDSMKKGFEECISKDKDAAPGVVVGAGFGKVENVEVDDVEYINAVCAVMKEYGYTSYKEAIAKIKLDMAKAYAVEATKDFAKMEGIKSTPVEIETNWIGEAAKATGNFVFRVGKRLVGRALEDVKSIFEIPVLLMELPENAYTLYQYIDENGIVKVFSDACEETGNEISVAWDTICEGTADEIADVVGDMIYTTAEILIPAGKIAKASKATKAAKVVGKVEDISDFSKDVKNASAFAQTAQNAAQKINRFSDVVETSQNLQEYADRMESETSYGKSSANYKNTADFMTNIECRNGKYYTDKVTIDEIGQIEARGEAFSALNKRIMSSRASTEGGTSIVYKYSDELGTKYLIHEVTDANGYIIHRDFDAVRISSGQLINKGH